MEVDSIHPLAQAPNREKSLALLTMVFFVVSLLLFDSPSQPEVLGMQISIASLLASIVMATLLLIFRR